MGMDPAMVADVRVVICVAEAPIWISLVRSVVENGR